MKSATLLLLCASCLFVRTEARAAVPPASDQKDATKIEERAHAAETVLSEVMNAPDKGIPKGVTANKDFSVSQASR